MEIALRENQGIKKSVSRNYGIDLLRCLAMMMVVMLHTLSRSGLLDKTAVPSLKYEVVWFIEIFCYCAVNCFVIISGYVGLHSKFRISRILLLWMQVAFYNVLLNLTVTGFTQADFSAEGIIHSFLPVSTNTYWFFTQYFVLSLLMPFINKLVLNITLKENTLLVGILVVVFSILPTLYGLPFKCLEKFDNNIFFENRGYSVLWLTVLYIIGAYLKRLVEENRLSKIKNFAYLITFIASDVFIWVIHYICKNRENPVSHYFIIAYISPFVLISAIGMVMFFSNLHFSKGFGKIIEFFAPYSFAVYLIHHQPQVYQIFKDLVEPMADMRLLKLLPCLLFTVLFVFIVCTVFDRIRGFFEKHLGIDKLCRRLDKLIKL